MIKILIFPSNKKLILGGFKTLGFSSFFFFFLIKRK